MSDEQKCKMILSGIPVSLRKAIKRKALEEDTTVSQLVKAYMEKATTLDPVESIGGRD